MKTFLSVITSLVLLTSCIDDGPQCGNGLVEGDEECDGSAFPRNKSCTSWGFNAGELRCSGDCKIDLSGCSAHYCGDGVVEGNEECDGDYTIVNNDCREFGYNGGFLHCSETCTLNYFECELYGVCGNGIIEGNEDCDGTVQELTVCEDYGYRSGVSPECNTDCTLDFTPCEEAGSCGDNIRQETWEECDGSDFGGESCSDYGWDLGALLCDGCSLNYYYCRDVFTSIDAGDRHICATDSSGRLYCWGNNLVGQLGTGNTSDRYCVYPVTSETGWAQVSAGDSYSCAVKTSGELYCWGQNWFDKLGIGYSEGNRNVPTRVGTDSDWAQVSCGVTHTCAIKTDGSMWCWGGSNNNACLGLGNGPWMSVPTRVGTSNDWVFVATGNGSSCGIKSNGFLYCWGSNYGGSLGTGDSYAYYTPEFTGELNMAFVTLGDRHGCGIKTDGRLLCWGSNSLGQAGGTTSNYTPTHINTDLIWSHVSAGYEHTCGVTTSGDLYCWGSNANGELGSDTISYSPTRIFRGSGYTMSATGEQFTCSWQSEGFIWCHGRGTDGQLGNGTNDNSKLPVEAPY
ncbi:hypothetical protein KKF34_03335 [Myxococcota bacterium]|nr:hypothetical protein [Myxococcota bacterium]MBU1380681.1 hypothetical protein [Myxococcota bacterium]MBU1495889.1 hypothetical protein [Myxococcota bacterium]